MNVRGRNLSEACLPQPFDGAAAAGVRRRLARLTKPPKSLGKLESLVERLAGIQGTDCPVAGPGALVVLAGDHGVAGEGVSPYPQAVTAQMVANFLAGGAAANVLAQCAGLELFVGDIGVACDVAAPKPWAARFLNDTVDCKVRQGTRNMRREPALTEREALAAVESGMRIAKSLIDSGVAVLALGEMGIANTTPSTAMICAFLGVEPEEVTGPGTGLDDEGVARKARVIREALALHRPDPRDPLGVLAKVGGLEIGALAGCMLYASSRRCPVILDGLITGAAALVAAGMQPEAADSLVASHCSKEPAHRLALDYLGLDPLLDLELCLGEGSGAALAMGLVQASTALLREMATFDEAGVSDRDEGSGSA